MSSRLHGDDSQRGGGGGRQDDWMKRRCDWWGAHGNMRGEKRRVEDGPRWELLLGGRWLISAWMLVEKVEKSVKWQNFLSLLLPWSFNVPLGSCQLSFSFFIPVLLTSLSPHPFPHPFPVSFFFPFLARAHKAATWSVTVLASGQKPHTSKHPPPRSPKREKH